MGALILRKSEAFINYCIKELGIVDEKRIEAAKYGVYHLLSALLKLPVIYIPAIVFGVFKEIIIASLVFSILRYFAGGIHAKTHQGCTLIGNVIMGYTPIIIGKLLGMINLNKAIIFNIHIILAATSLAIVAKYAPADLKSKPVYSKDWRNKLRAGAAICIAIGYILGVTVLNNYIATVIMVAILIECLSITPLAYRLFKNRYGAGSGVN